MKNIIRILFGLPVVLSVPLSPTIEDCCPKPAAIDALLLGLANPIPPPPPILKDQPPITVDKDEIMDCCDSCGYSYCPSLDSCVRPWETYCQEFQFPYNALWTGAGIVVPPPLEKQTKKTFIHHTEGH